MTKKIKSYFSDFIFGAIDGLVTTFAVVSGVIGAGLSANIILILGFASLFADGFSMAASNYLSTKSENDLGQSGKNASGAALITLLAFIIIGFVPLISFVFDFGDRNYLITTALTGIAFFTVGFLKGVVTRTNSLASALQTFCIGAAAAVIAFSVGHFLATLIG